MMSTQKMHKNRSNKYFSTVPTQKKNTIYIPNSRPNKLSYFPAHKNGMLIANKYLTTKTKQE